MDARRDFASPDPARPAPALVDTLTAAVAAGRGRPESQRERATAVLKAAVADARESARRELEAGGGGLTTARRLAAAVDAAITALYDAVTAEVFPAPNQTEGERLAIVALGGYGRGALAPHSDVDLLFLRPYKPTAHSESVIEFMLYALWDAGLKIGQASRTVDDCLRLAAQDATIRTALVDARLIAGDKRLADDLERRFRKSAQAKGAAAAFVAAKLEERDRRHARAGASRFLVEPNIKEGKGALRDLDTLHWIAAFLWGTEAQRRLRQLRAFDPRDREALDRSTEFLWSVRCHLHFTAGRAEERLSFDVQPEIARRMGFVDRGPHAGVERFMRRYFSAAREVGALTRTFCAELEARHAKARPAGLSRLWPARTKPGRRLDEPGFRLEAGRLAIDSGRTFRRDPANLLRLFHIADREDLDLHPTAVAAVRRALPMITPRLRRDPQAARLFLDILTRGRNTYRTLSLMTETGLLGRYLTEFNHTVGLMQFNMYHAYTVDEHTLRAVGVIADIAAGRLTRDHPLSSSIYPLITDKAALHLAMLLHDTGKGGAEDQETAGEKAARKACKRLGLAPERIDLIGWLVGHHLLMSDTAQKRDIGDPRTVETFARLVETPERLRMLLVLTVADIRAVGPDVWNAWKGELLRELYIATERLFRGEQAQSASDDGATSAPAPAPGVEARFDETRRATEITVVAPDRDGLFADLAAVLAEAGAQVVAAQVRTADGQARDVFYAQDVTGAPFGQDNPARLRRLRAALGEAAQGRPRRPARRSAMVPRHAAFSIAPAVSWDNEASADSTVIEASGRDRPGLLAALARAITLAGVSIRSAHIGGYGERAVDAFYVRAQDGQKLSRAEAAGLKTALLAVMAETSDAPRPEATVSARR